MRTVTSALRFPGGVHPNDNKGLVRDKPIETLPLPKQLVISMAQHRGTPATCTVKVGEHVACGQLIGAAFGPLAVPVHASAAGTVKAIEARQTPSGAWAEAVVLETDADQTATPPLRFDPLNWKKASPDALLARVAEAGICGMGGAGFPTAIKLRLAPGRKCDYLIVNGAECEPYLSADFRVMVEWADRIRSGIEIVRKILGGPAVRIAIEENKPEAVVALENALDDITGDVEIVVLPMLYPQGSEKHQVYATTGRQIAPGELPVSVGCVVENVATVAAIARAVEQGEPLTARVTSVSGDGIAEPKNVFAPFGTASAELAAFCGGEKPGVRKVLSGGVMTGMTLPDLTIPTTKTTSGLLFLTGARTFEYKTAPCINCGRCVRTCPMGLNPGAISRAVEADDIDRAESLHVISCIECGACSFSCPAFRSITHYCRRAKSALRARQMAARAAVQKASH